LLERRRLVTWRQDADSSNFRPVALALRDLDAVWEFENGLAVLSGCASAGGADRGEPMGLPQLFWEAGVRNMLGTSWSVEDGASTLFMARFYSSLVARMETRRSWRSITARDVAVAAQEARRSVREFRDSEGRQVFEHPVYWSGFTSWGIAGQ
jgi:CHAT domain-containing protein